MEITIELEENLANEAKSIAPAGMPLEAFIRQLVLREIGNARLRRDMFLFERQRATVIMQELGLDGNSILPPAEVGG